MYKDAEKRALVKRFIKPMANKTQGDTEENQTRHEAHMMLDIRDSIGSKWTDSKHLG